MSRLTGRLGGAAARHPWRTIAAWLVSGDARDAVVRGLGSTARVISSAAAIMIAVFIDATLIRLVLAPAAMVLLGRAGWWLPRPLARRGAPAAAPEFPAVPAEAGAAS